MFVITYPCMILAKRVSEGCFTNVLRALQNNFEKYAMPEITFMVRWHMYEALVRNSHTNYDFCNTHIWRIYIGELAKRYWDNPQVSISYGNKGIDFRERYVFERLSSHDSCAYVKANRLAAYIKMCWLNTSRDPVCLQKADNDIL